MELQKVGIVGCGLMGSGIAEVAARAGLDVLVAEVGEDEVARGRSRIEGSLARAVEKGKATGTERDEAVARVRFTTDLETRADRDVVVEAVVEELEVKRRVFGILDGACRPATLLASNTSSLPITEIAAGTSRPERVVGLHFFNPVPVMPLVEIVSTLATSDVARERAHRFARLLGKETVTAKDRSGFLVNLLLVPFLLDAVRQVERGAASVADIDRAMVLGCGHPMGPLTLCDFVGLDTTLRIADIMFEEYREGRYAAPPLLRRLVAAGRRGRKSGKGFYDYSGDTPEPLPEA